MRNLSGHTSPLASGEPGAPEVSDATALPMEEPRNHHAPRDFNLARHGKLALKDRS
jgi:hypothetical protein